MDIRTAFATQSYAQTREIAAPEAQEGGVFSQLAKGFVETLDVGEATARAAMTGGADPHALVEALAASSLAVETATTVRDRVVEAYQEILRMPV